MFVYTYIVCIRTCRIVSTYVLCCVVHGPATESKTLGAGLFNTSCSTASLEGCRGEEEEEEEEEGEEGEGKGKGGNALRVTTFEEEEEELTQNFDNPIKQLDEAPSPLPQ